MLERGGAKVIAIKNILEDKTNARKQEGSLASGYRDPSQPQQNPSEDTDRAQPETGKLKAQKGSE